MILGDGLGTVYREAAVGGGGEAVDEAAACGA